MGIFIICLKSMFRMFSERVSEPRLMNTVSIYLKTHMRSARIAMDTARIQSPGLPSVPVPKTCDSFSKICAMRGDSGGRSPMTESME